MEGVGIFYISGDGQTILCDCGAAQQTIDHILNFCAIKKLDGGLEELNGLTPVGLQWLQNLDIDDEKRERDDSSGGVLSILSEAGSEHPLITCNIIEILWQYRMLLFLPHSPLQISAHPEKRTAVMSNQSPPHHRFPSGLFLEGVVVVQVQRHHPSDAEPCVAPGEPEERMNAYTQNSSKDALQCALGVLKQPPEEQQGPSWNGDVGQSR
ncbi:hypothetical protein J437_LFUL012901 [Ladona fulva]|uniref:Uncharacterized protein n=1 Tax=Ladona fulva TaxID=123851 RepID=A0A8K0P3Q9_LADFU|nr:hypothetical protein J437_LFUL012901 [Ladona fulva]